MISIFGVAVQMAKRGDVARAPRFQKVECLGFHLQQLLSVIGARQRFELAKQMLLIAPANILELAVEARRLGKGGRWIGHPIFVAYLLG